MSPSWPPAAVLPVFAGTLSSVAFMDPVEPAAGFSVRVAPLADTDTSVWFSMTPATDAEK